MLERAIKYAKAGFPVMPLCYPKDGECGCGRNHQGKNIGKVPLTEHGLTDATIDLQRVKEYWEYYPLANIGVAIPDGYFVLDIDGIEGYESLGVLQTNTGALPETLQVTTGSGGSHFWYKTKRPIRNTTKLAGYAGLDIRGVGGYVVSPPSIHKCGLLYALSPVWSGPIKEASASLVSVCTKNYSRPVYTPAAEPDAPIIDGERNDRLTRDAGSMRRRGLSEEAILAALTVINQERCRPPLDEKELANIARSVNRYAPEIDNYNTTKSRYKTYD